MPSLSYGTSHPGCYILSTLYSSPREHCKSHRERGGTYFFLVLSRHQPFPKRVLDHL